MQRKVWALTVFAALACVAGRARADISYVYVTDATSYAASNGSATVNVYLDEVLTNGTTASLINGDNGLFGGAFAVNVQSGPGTISKVTLNTASPTNGGFGTNGSQFDQTFVSSDGSTASGVESEAIGSTSGVQATQASNSGGTIVNQILLGTATISGVTADTKLSVTSLANAPANNTLAQNFGEGNTVTFNSNYDLDSTDNGFNGGPPPTYTGADDNSYTFTVAAVPEPNGLVLSGVASCGLLLGGLGYAGYRRRKAKLLKVDAAA